jgi:predicted HTH transcriptional regulator
LFVHIPESSVKPVHLRGKSLEVAYIRTGGTTRLASRPEFGTMMSQSRVPRWEESRASPVRPNRNVLAKKQLARQQRVQLQVLPRRRNSR